ncbi:alpha/beta hydrolase [Pelagibius litoralis]|uniref:Alpha/beta hydrolase n=1 Tax=Pelagibius litoralis TaxID=374515 RepID=A0A967F060_9PROT|nr:alpha/beta hydrolase [Pelagibius litoralis]NIA70629.1 alpha/beta hydrolase [Pelagibius litoralis]
MILLDNHNPLCQGRVVQEGASAQRGRRSVRLPVLALHSSASSGGQWKALGDYLAWEREVLTPDLPGYGEAAESSVLMAPADLAREADWLLRHAGLPPGPFHLVGHSYGGAVALKLALLAPQRISSLTLIEPVLFHLLSTAGNRRAGKTETTLYRQILGLRDRVRGAVAAGWPAHGMEAFVDFWSGKDAWQRLAQPKRQALARQAKSVLRNFEAVLAEAWPIKDVAGLDLPLQTIFGARSPEVSRRLTELLTDVTGRATGTQIFTAGHMAPLTHSATVNAAIVHHIEVAEGRRRRPIPLPPASPLVA